MAQDVVHETAEPRRPLRAAAGRTTRATEMIAAIGGNFACSRARPGPGEQSPVSNPPTAADPPIRGMCHIFLAFDVATSVDLTIAAGLLSNQATRPNVSARFRAPEFIAYEPAPLRVTQACGAINVGAWGVQPSVDITVFDFGAASVEYHIPLDGPLSGLATLSDLLATHAGIREDARARLATLVQTITPALQRPSLSEAIEDYAVFALDPASVTGDPDAALLAHAPTIARIFRGGDSLSDQEVKDATGARLSFTRRDAAVVDWSAAVVIDADPADVLTILEFANIELLEMRLLDDRLDRTLAVFYETFSRRHWWRRILSGGSRDLRRLAAMQTDAALMFEGVNNAIKLVGDQYLARLYRAASARMGVPEWQTSVRRKLATLESIHSKVADHGAAFRMEALEWTIVILILFEVVMSLVRG